MRNKGYFKILTIQYGGAEEESFSPDCQPSESGLRKTRIPVSYTHLTLPTICSV